MPISHYETRRIFLPSYFNILLTQKCNFQCDFCEFDCSLDKTAAIDINDFEKILKEGKTIGISKVVLDGGEPLIYKDINRAMQFCHEYGYEVTILTNGWHFEDYLPQFKKYNIRNFIFGINGATAKTNDQIMGKKGAFKRVVKAIKKSKESGFFTGLHFVIHPLNIKELDRFFDLAKRWKVDYIHTSRIIRVGRARNSKIAKKTSKQISKILAIYKKWSTVFKKIILFKAYEGKANYLRCKYSSQSAPLAVCWDGQILMCPMNALLKLPFKRISDYSLRDCLDLVNKVNVKFQAIRDREFPKWRLLENPYLFCEYCYDKLSKNGGKFFV